MKSPARFDEIIAMPPPLPASELRDWRHLPDLALNDVLCRLVPCIRSLCAFAATCRPWRRFLVASASTLLRRIPPLTLQPQPYPDDKTAKVFPFSPLVMRKSFTYPLPAIPSTLLSSSRWHLILLVRPRGLLFIVDALTGAERLAVSLLSPGFPYHYACLTTTHLLIFVSKHLFVSLPFPTPNPIPEWTNHRIPREASFVTAVIDFRGRVLGVTDRAELLEFRLDADTPDDAVQLLPATGLPISASFEHRQFGPHLVGAGDRVLLVLIITNPDGDGDGSMTVQKVIVHALNMETMRWEELDNIGEYSLFVDCAGRSTVACADAGDCAVMDNQVYVLSPYGCRKPGLREPFLPGSDVPNCSPWPARVSLDRQWPLQTDMGSSEALLLIPTVV